MIAHKSFSTPETLSTWLADNHASAKELWVKIYKKASGKPSVTWTDCIVEAIRYGWIDGQKKPLDESSFLQRLSPRRPRSNWSSKNRDHALKLIEQGRMTPAGLAHVKAAQKGWALGEGIRRLRRDGDSRRLPVSSRQAAQGQEILRHLEPAESVLDLLSASLCQKAGDEGEAHGPDSTNAGKRDRAALKTGSLSGYFVQTLGQFIR